ncbi:MAG: DUF6783 domain-containing protein [Ruminococcus sp.]
MSAPWSLFEKSFQQSPTTCNAHLAENLFQTRSKTYSNIKIRCALSTMFSHLPFLFINIL